MNEEERFWSHVDKSGDCWIWTSYKRGEYGLFKTDERKSIGAHRYSYTLAYGHPGKLFVCHRCDVPACVNPGHLFAGSHTENMHDMVQKNRYYAANITKDQVIAARTLAGHGVEVRAICNELNTDFDSTIRAIRGETWQHLTVPAPLEPVFERKKWYQKLSDQDIVDIQKALETPYWGINRDLGAKYGVTASAIGHIKRGMYGTRISVD